MNENIEGQLHATWIEFKILNNENSNSIQIQIQVNSYLNSQLNWICEIQLEKKKEKKELQLIDTKKVLKI